MPLKLSGDDSGHSVVSDICWVHGQDGRCRSGLHRYSPTLSGIRLASVVGLGLVIEVDEVGSERLRCAPDFTIEFGFRSSGAWERNRNNPGAIVKCAQRVIYSHRQVVDHSDPSFGGNSADFVELKSEQSSIVGCLWNVWEGGVG